MRLTRLSAVAAVGRQTCRSKSANSSRLRPRPPSGCKTSKRDPLRWTRLLRTYVQNVVSLQYASVSCVTGPCLSLQDPRASAPTGGPLRIGPLARDLVVLLFPSQGEKTKAVLLSSKEGAVVFLCLSSSSDDHPLSHSCLGTGVRFETQQVVSLSCIRCPRSLSADVRGVGGSSITILPLLVQIIRTLQPWQLLVRCVGKHVTVSRYCRFRITF